MSIVTLKPGLLVSLHTRMEGGVRYTRTDLAAESVAKGDGAAVERWETTKVTEDPAEHARGTKVRGKCGSLVRSVCTASSFGLLCLTKNEAALDAAIAEARALAEAFNATASTVRVSVFAMRGRIAESDDEAARAVASEIKALVDGMRAGIDERDVEAIREAASKAKKLGAMLDPGAAGKVAAAVEEARAAAREIAKKLVAGGDKASIVISQLQTKSLEEARFAFLDLDDAAPIAGAPLPSVAPRALDLDDDGEGSGGQDEGGSPAAAAASGEG